MEQKRYTTERGITIRVVPIPLLLDKIREAHEPPERPTYTEHIAGGATDEVEITDEMAATWAKDDPDTWAEHADKWDEYAAKRDELQEKLNDRMWLATIRKAIVFDMPEDDSWIAEHESFGLTIPKDETEQRVHYIRTEVIGGMRDVLKITALANGSDLTEEALALAEGSFRHSLARTLTGGLANQGQPLEDEHEGDADSGSEGVAAQAE